MLDAEVKRRRFDVEEYHWMGRVGILSADDRVELVRGEVVEMTPIGSLHQSCVNVLNHLFGRSLGERFTVRVQGPVRLGESSEPQPDLAVLERRSDFYRASHPTPDDIVLLVEVSDTTLAYARNTKLPLYAGAGVGEVWILDLEARAVEIHTEPSDSGYTQSKTCRIGDEARSRTLPDLALPVAGVFG